MSKKNYDNLINQTFGRLIVKEILAMRNSEQQFPKEQSGQERKRHRVDASSPTTGIVLSRPL